MDPILDESSLVPCPSIVLGDRIRKLADTLKGLDDLGVSPVLRSVKDAFDRDIGEGKGLRFWCFNNEIDRDSGRLVAFRLNKQPFIDGRDGLFSRAEGEKAIEGSVSGKVVFGLALAALNESIAILFGSCPGSVATAGNTDVSLTFFDGNNFSEERRSVRCLADPKDIEDNRDWIIDRVKKSLKTGYFLIERAPEVFPRLKFGPKAIEQIRDLNGCEPFFSLLVRHLSALDKAAKEWRQGPFFPGGTWSPESESTLNHREYGPMRDFPVPEGYKLERWSNHIKLTGNGNFRLYFRFEQSRKDCSVVLIGYFGPHLPTTNHPT